MELEVYNFNGETPGTRIGDKFLPAIAINQNNLSITLKVSKADLISFALQKTQGADDEVIGAMTGMGFKIDDKWLYPVDFDVREAAVILICKIVKRV